MRVLLLTAGYGEGHNAAARGLQAAFSELGHEAEVADLFAVTGGAFYNFSRRSYLDLINRAPKVWGWIYGWIDRLPVMEFSLPASAPLRDALAERLEKSRPDAVLSVYPVYGYLAEQLGRIRGGAHPFRWHTVVTDSITINSVWYRCASDTFLVPNEESAQVLRDRGVPAEKIHAVGFPVRPCFADPRPARPAPGTGSPLRVLFMVNGGRDLVPSTVARLLQIEGVHLTVTVGRDAALGEQLAAEAKAVGKSLELHGWTERMPELVMSHHLLIGKAGGATVQEAIAACTPMLITQVVPGQEEGNAQLLLQNHCGALCQTPEALASQVGALLAGGHGLWHRWEKAIASISKPDAARDIVRLVAGALPAGQPAAALV